MSPQWYGISSSPGISRASSSKDRVNPRWRSLFLAWFLVRQALGSLPDQEKEIFLRYYYYAQSVKEVARSMGLKEGTVKTKLKRGRVKLKETLMREGFAYEA